MPQQFSLRRWLLDRLCLRPTTHELDFRPQELFWIEDAPLRLACYRQTQVPRSRADSATLDIADRAVELLIIKFPGNAGRAELSPIHPANVWPEKRIEVWSINPPGYGQSPGRASLDHVPAIARSVWQAAQREHPNTPVLVYGNSIGSLTAMRTIAVALEDQQAPAMGLLLRNPPDLFPLIMEHRRRWYHGPVPRWLTSPAILRTDDVAAENRVTSGSPPHLDSVALASACHCPLLLVQAELDRMVPPTNQDRVFSAHPGPKSKFIIPAADHHQAPDPADQEVYQGYTAAIAHAFSAIVSPN